MLYHFKDSGVLRSINPKRLNRQFKSTNVPYRLFTSSLPSSFMAAMWVGSLVWSCFNSIVVDGLHGSRDIERTRSCQPCRSGGASLYSSFPPSSNPELSEVQTSSKSSERQLGKSAHTVVYSHNPGTVGAASSLTYPNHAGVHQAANMHHQFSNASGLFEARLVYYNQGRRPSTDHNSAVHSIVSSHVRSNSKYLFSYKTSDFS